MTIKEMSKVYKKVVKLVEVFKESATACDGVTILGDYDHITAKAKELAKASQNLRKIHVALGFGDEDCNILMYHISSEEDFIRFCFMNEVETAD